MSCLIALPELQLCCLAGVPEGCTEDRRGQERTGGDRALWHPRNSQQGGWLTGSRARSLYRASEGRDQHQERKRKLVETSEVVTDHLGGDFHLAVSSPSQQGSDRKGENEAESEETWEGGEGREGGLDISSREKVMPWTGL